MFSRARISLISGLARVPGCLNSIKVTHGSCRHQHRTFNSERIKVNSSVNANMLLTVAQDAECVCLTVCTSSQRCFLQKDRHAVVNISEVNLKYVGSRKFSSA